MAKKRPDVSDVATRAIILKHVAVYAFVAPPRDMLEQLMAKWSDADRHKFAVVATARRDEFWSRLGPLEAALSPWERDYSGSTMLTMSKAQQANASWRMEAFQVLAWALGVVGETPPYDVEADRGILKSFPPDEPARFIESALLRPTQLIDTARDIAELWHWRSRTRQLVEEGHPFPQSPEARSAGLRSHDDVVRLAASSAAREGSIPSVVAGDFPAFGKAYRDLAPEEWATVRSITLERHFAFNWLCGHSPEHRWDDTPTDT
jgi:hypothetical protein